MQAVLEAIDAELESARALVGKLEAARALLADDEEAEPAAPVTPTKKKPAPKPAAKKHDRRKDLPDPPVTPTPLPPPPPGPGRESSNAKHRNSRSKIRNAMHSKGKMTATEICEIADLNIGTVGRHLREMAMTGEVLITGAGPRTRYEHVHLPHTEHRAATEAGKKTNAAAEKDAILRIKVKDLVTRRQGDYDLGQLAAAMSRPIQDVEVATLDLMAAGQIRERADGTYQLA